MQMKIIILSVAIYVALFLIVKILTWLKLSVEDDSVKFRKRCEEVNKKLKIRMEEVKNKDIDGLKKAARVYLPSKDPYSEFNGNLDDHD